MEYVGYVAEAEQERQVVHSHLAHDRVQEKELFAMVKDAIVHEEGGWWAGDNRSQVGAR